MAIRKEELENPMVIERFIPKPPTTRHISSTACDVCDTYEAVIKLHHTKLCPDCALEEGLVVL